MIGIREQLAPAAEAPLGLFLAVTFSPTQLQAEFSVAYVHAIATAAGFSMQRDTIDEDSIDVTISAKGDVEGRFSPRFGAQLKCTFGHDPSDGVLSYPLKLKNYEDLRRPNVTYPRILIVVHVPEDVLERVAWSPNALVLRNCGYWKSLKGFPATENATTVSIQLGNHLSVAELTRVMSLTARGEI